MLNDFGHPRSHEARPVHALHAQEPCAGLRAVGAGRRPTARFGFPVRGVGEAPAHKRKIYKLVITRRFYMAPKEKKPRGQPCLQPATSNLEANSLAASSRAATKFNDPINKFGLWNQEMC